MVVESRFILFIKAFEVGQSQNEDLFRVPLSPIIYDPEESLITMAEQQLLVKEHAHFHVVVLIY